MEMPKNIVIEDKMVRRRRASCNICGARLFVGEYEDLERGDEVLAAWVLHHKHLEDSDNG